MTSSEFYNTCAKTYQIQFILKHLNKVQDRYNALQNEMVSLLSRGYNLTSL